MNTEVCGMGKNGCGGRVLICGATGFIGRNIAESLVDDSRYEVIGVYNRRAPFDMAGLQWVQADLTDPAQVDKIMEGVDILIQSAATTSGSKDIVSRPHIHTTDNAVMNSFLFRSAFERKVRHVIFFSCTVMLQSSESALTENDFDASMEIHPRYFGAGWTKVYLEKMCEFYSRIGSTKFTVIRHSNIYGPYDKFDLELSHVFGATITKVMETSDTITIWGTGEESRDLLYVDDLVDFVRRAVERQSSTFEIYNCGSGQATLIRDLIHKIIEASGKRLAVEHDLSQPNIKTSLFLDCTKAKQELGWRPEHSLEEGIAKTIAWWKANIG